MNAIINFFSGLSSKPENKKNVKENHPKFENDPDVEKLRICICQHDYQGAWELLENGINPNIPLEIDCVDWVDGQYPMHNTRTILALDDITDKAMIKLLRAYGAKTSKELETERIEREKQEYQQQKHEHEMRSNILVETLLKKRNYK